MIMLWARTSVTVRASSVAAVTAAWRITSAPATTRLARANRVSARRVLVGSCDRPAGPGRWVPGSGSRAASRSPPSSRPPSRLEGGHAITAAAPAQATPARRARPPASPALRRSVVATLVVRLTATALVIPRLDPAAATLVVARPGLALAGAGGRGGGVVVIAPAS